MTLGIDVVGIARFRELLERCPAFAGRFFSPTELDYCSGASDPARHLAGTFAAKEAVVKATGIGPVVAWARRIEVRRGQDGKPAARVEGRDIEVSISHDAGIAAAVAFAPPRNHQEMT